MPLRERQYLKYVAVFRLIERCYHEMLQPQKRQFVKRLLEAVMFRLVELKDVEFSVHVMLCFRSSVCQQLRSISVGVPIDDDCERCKLEIELIPRALYPSVLVSVFSLSLTFTPTYTHTEYR